MFRFVSLCAVLAVAAVSPLTGAPATEQIRTPAVLTVMGHDSMAVSEEVITAFEREHGVEVRLLHAGDAGTALNRAILAKGNPLADVLYGVDNAFLSRALDAEIFEPYAPPRLAVVPAELQLDPSGRAVPIDYGDVCVNYDQRALDAAGLEPPRGLEDLLEPAYAGMLVVQDPATSSPGLAFLLATIGHFGEDGYLEYWRRLRANGVTVAGDWETAYFQMFSGGTATGDRPLVVSYGSSPPFEVIYAEEPIEAPSTGVVTGPGSCFRQVEFAGILAGTPRRALAERWLDYMLSPAFQQDMPLNMFVFPVVPDAALAPEFERFLAIPERPAQVSPELISTRREHWIRSWREAMGR